MLLASVPTICSLLATLGMCEGAKFLAFLAVPAKSHQAVFTPLLRELANRGHQVTAYVPFPMPDPPKTYKEVILSTNFFGKMQAAMDIRKMSKVSPLLMTFMFYRMGLQVQEDILSHEAVQELMNSDEKYDAVILESFFIQEAFAALRHKFGAIGIEMMPAGHVAWINSLVGNPHNPSYVVDFKVDFTDRMTFHERVYNTVTSVWTNALGYLYYLPMVQRMIDAHLNYTGSQDRPYIADILSSTSLVLTNSHFAVNYPYPMAPHVVEVGGIHIKPGKPLPEDLQKFMDEATDGVIYFSLGSNLNVSDIATGEIFTAFQGAFSKLKQKVLWKWEKGELPDKPPNVKTSKWFPQQDILAHKNCKLFITHGGFLSLSESIHFGVPVIGIPVFGDQKRNVRQVTYAGTGLQLDLDDITEESLSRAIKESLSNPSYREKAKERSELFRDRPLSPLESAVFWVEWVVRHGGAAQLRPASASLPWYQLHLVDVYAALLAAALLAVVLIYSILKSLMRLLCGRKVQKITTSKKSKRKAD